MYVLPAAEKLAKEGISVEVLDLRSIRPLDEEGILASVRKTNKVLIVEEGWNVAGFGAQVAYLIQKEAFDYLDSPVERITQEDVPMPYAANLERSSLPSEEKIIKKVRDMIK